MTTDFVTDTHGLIWYLEDSPRLGDQAKLAFDACDHGDCFIYIPTICLVEMIYLQEKGRIAAELLHQLHTELHDGDNGFLIADLTVEVTFLMITISRATVPDMPDRIIAATARQLGLPLISRDRRIQLSDLQTIW